MTSWMILAAVGYGIGWLAFVLLKSAGLLREGLLVEWL